jgi:hypothetical protein
VDVFGDVGHQRADVDHAGVGHRFRRRDSGWRVGARNGGHRQESDGGNACSVLSHTNPPA